MRHLKRIIIVCIWFFNFSSCTDDDIAPGPCYPVYKEPIFNIIELKDSLNDLNITNAKIFNLRINGKEKIGSFGYESNYGIVYKDSFYYCNIPCGFKFEKGTYEFTIIAEGYKEKYVKYNNVDYSIFTSGCPFYYDGGKKVSIKIIKN